MAPFRSHEQSRTGKWLRFGAKTKNFSGGLIFRHSRCLPSEGNFEKALNKLGLFIIYQLKRKNLKSSGKIRKKFGKGKVRGASRVPLVDLDNGIAVTETDKTVRRPRKSEHSNTAETPGQAYKNDIGSTALNQKHNYQRKKEGETHEQATTDRCRYPVL